MMSHKIATPYVLMVRNLEKLCKRATADFFEGKFETLIKYEREKKKVVEKLISEFGVSTINDDRSYDFIKQIYPKDNTTSGRLYDALCGDLIDDGLFQDDELSRLASSLFYSRTCGEDYVENLLEIGKIVLKIDVPQDLHVLVEEARRCFAFDRYIAVCALSRTIIEAFLLHLCDMIGEEPYRNKHGRPIRSSIFKIVSRGNERLKDNLDSLYHRASRVIHGDKMSNRRKAKEIFQETISLVQDIYELHKI